MIYEQRNRDEGRMRVRAASLSTDTIKDYGVAKGWLGRRKVVGR